MIEHLTKLAKLIITGMLLMTPLLALGAADDIARLYTFSSGQVIQSSQVNGELNQLVGTLNNKFGRGIDNTSTGNNTFSGTNTFSGITTFSHASSPVKTDILLERTPNNGINIDNVLLKDGYINVDVEGGDDPGTPVNGDFWYDATTHTYQGRANGSTVTVATTGDIPVNALPTKYLSGAPVAWVSVSQVKIPSGFRARSSDDTLDMVVTGDRTCSLASSGANGLDTGSEASNTWYYVYLIDDSTAANTEACLLSVTNESVSGSITLPSGYNKKRQLPMAVRNDGSSNLIDFYVVGGWPYRPHVRYNVAMSTAAAALSATNILDSGTATSWASVTVSSYAPVGISSIAEINMLKETGNINIQLRPGDSSGNGKLYWTALGSGGTLAGASDFVKIDTADGSIDYQLTTTGAVSLDINGFIVTGVN